MHKTKFKLNSINTKLIISMISLCIIPLIFIGLGAYYVSKSILSEKLETTSGQTLREVSISLDNYFEGLNMQITSASKNDHLIEIDSNDQNINNAYQFLNTIFEDN